MNGSVENGRNLTAVLAEMKNEFREFVQTRIAILRTELMDKLKTIKSAGPAAAIAVVFIATAYLLFTLALVGLLAASFAGNPYQWFFAFLIVGVVWTVVGGVAAYYAKRKVNKQGLVLTKTIGVLKGDKVWIQSEVKNPL